MFSFAHPPGKLALPSRLHELQLQRTLLSSSLSVDKICGGGVLLKNEKKKKKKSKCSEVLGQPNRPRNTERPLKKIYVSKFVLFFNLPLPIDCLMIYYVFDECNHISQ